MNAGDDLAAAHAQRRRSRRALAEAEAAAARLDEARERAGTLLRRTARESSGTAAPAEAQAPPDETEDVLGRRMRHIEDRMQRTDTRMRIAETETLRVEDDGREHGHREGERREGERRDENETSPPEQRR